MADLLASVTDLNNLLDTTIPTARATLLLECATGVVQAAAGQRIVQATETITLDGNPTSWLQLPELPVTAVTSVKLDGAAIAAGTGTSQYRRRASRLYRGDGWATYRWEPSEVEVAYTHGWAANHQRLQLARSAVLGLAAQAANNPGAVQTEKIDDYSVTYAQIQAGLEASPHLAAALVRQYGRTAGLVRLG